MAIVIFYEKSGCANNRRQKRTLQDAGHEVIEKDLLQERWRVSDLIRFFNGTPLAEWFNPSAPAIKSGEIVPEKMNETEALMSMLADPLLIRRPLMQVGDTTMVGFDPEAVDRWIGLNGFEPRSDVSTCGFIDTEKACSTT